MKILNKQEFLKLPENVLYCCNPDSSHVGFHNLRIKGETLSLSNDWYEVSVTEYEHYDFGQLCSRHDEMLKGASYPLEISACRNGLFEDDNIFLVYEAKDLRELQIRLDECIGCDQV